MQLSSITLSSQTKPKLTVWRSLDLTFPFRGVEMISSKGTQVLSFRAIIWESYFLFHFLPMTDSLPIIALFWIITLDHFPFRLPLVEETEGRPHWLILCVDRRLGSGWAGCSWQTTRGIDSFGGALCGPSATEWGSLCRGKRLPRHRFLFCLKSSERECGL